LVLFEKRSMRSFSLFLHIGYKALLVSFKSTKKISTKKAYSNLLGTF